MQPSCSSAILLADEFFNVYLNAIPGAKWHSGPELIEIPHSSILLMQPLNFTIGDRVFTMDVAAQLIPKARNTAYCGDPKKQYGVVGKLGEPSGQGLDFTLGIPFLQRYYTVSRSPSSSKHKVIKITFGRYSTQTPTALDLLRRKSWSMPSFD